MKISMFISLLSRVIFDFAFHYSKIRHQEGKVNDIPFMLVCEEAHNYIPQSGGAEYSASKHSIERIAKEGRKYGLNLMVVSQRPSEVSETIFSQCNNFIVLKLTNVNDQSCIKNLLPDNNASLVDVLPTLAAGECLVVGDAVPLPAVIKMDMPDPVPNSSNVNVFDEWNKDWIDIALLWPSLTRRCNHQPSDMPLLRRRSHLPPSSLRPWRTAFPAPSHMPQ